VTDDYIDRIAAAGIAERRRIASIAADSSEEMRRRQNGSVLDRLDALADALQQIARRTDRGSDTAVFDSLSVLADEIATVLGIPLPEDWE